MNHVVIMKKEWGLLPLILSGKKTVEDRWYKSKIAPWDRVKAGDTLYFKDSGSPVTVKAKVTQVGQYKVASNEQASALLQKYALTDLGSTVVPDSVKNYAANKKYAIFVHFRNARKITPFYIDKTGYGLQCAWMCAGDVNKLKKTPTNL